MSNTTIKIKRSSANATPASLLEGELAYSFLSNTLFIGNQSNSPIAIVSSNSSGISANTVRISKNGTNSLNRKQLNFVDSPTTTISVIDALNGNANVAVSVSSNLFVEVLRANGFIDFTKTAAALEPSYKEGRVWYSTSTKTLMVKSANPEFDSRVGDTLWFYGYNNTGLAISKGAPVYVTGVDNAPDLGLIASIDLADASVYSKKDVIGLAAHDIPNGESGHILIYGYISGLNTAALTGVGQRVHLGWINAGTLSNVSGSYPNFPMEIGRCIQSDPTNGILFVDVIDHSFEGIRVSDEAYFSGNVTILGSSYVQLNSTVYGNVIATGQVLSSGIDILATALAAANKTQVYANGALRVSNSALNFNNTSTIRVGVVSNGNGQANVSFDLIGSSGIASFPVSGNGVSTVSANGLNFVNTTTVGITVTSGVSGNANIFFTTLSGGGTVTSVATGIGLAGGPISSSGTISANIASTTVQGVTKLIDVVTSTDSANAATANIVKVVFDQTSNAYNQANTAYGQANTANTTAVSAYGQANLAYSQANTANAIAITAYGQANTARDQANIAYATANNSANATRVTANSGASFSNVSLNFVNTSTVQVSVTSGAAGVANIAFNSTATGGGGIGTANLYIQDSPPSSPKANQDFWWQSNTGSLKIYYSDGDSSQWVDAFVPLASSGGSFSGTVNNINVTNSLLITNAASVVANSNQFYTGGNTAPNKAIFTANAPIKDIITSGYYSTSARLGDPGYDFTSYNNGITKTFYHYGAFQNTTFDAANNDISEQYGFYASDLRGGALYNDPGNGATINYAFYTNINTRTGFSQPIGYAFYAGGNASSYFGGSVTINGPVTVQGANVLSTTTVYANSGSVQHAKSLNFVNTSTVTVSVASGSTGIANIAFTSTSSGGVTVANTTVQGITKLIDLVNSNDTGNAATANSVKAAYDQAVIGLNTVTVSANGTTISSGKRLNFVNTTTVVVSVVNSPDGNANISFTSTSSGGGSFSGTVNNINVTNSLLVTNSGSVVANSSQFYTGAGSAGNKAIFTANAPIKDIVFSGYYSTRSSLGDPGYDFTEYTGGSKTFYHYGAFQNTTFDSINNDLTEQYAFYASDLTGGPTSGGRTTNYGFYANVNTRVTGGGSAGYAVYAAGNASSYFGGSVTINAPLTVQGANVLSTTTVYANGGSVQHAKSLNFVNTSTVTVSVASGSTGNADVSFSYKANGLYTIWVPATSMFPRSSNGANAVWTEGTTNKINMRTFDFSNTSQNFVQFSIRMPKAWDRGTIQYEPSWTAFAGSGTVSWNVAAVAFSDNDWLDGTPMGTPRTSTDTLQNLNYLHVGPQPATPITVAGSPAAGDVVWFEVSRDVSGSTIAANTKLIGVTLFINVNAKDDT
jgi:hypothetical protein